MLRPFTLFDPAFVAGLRDNNLAAQITAALLSHWNLDETTGTRYDATGSGRDFIEEDSVEASLGKFGNAADFLDTDASFHTGSLKLDYNTAILPDVGESRTYTCWVYTNTGSGVLLTIFDVVSTVWNNNIFQLISDGSTDGTFTLKVANYPWGDFPQTVTTPNTFHYHTWHFIAITIGAENKISVDGQDWAVSTGGMNQRANAALTPLRICSYSYVGQTPAYATLMQAVVDHLSLFERALTIEEIRWLYNSGNGRAYPYAA